MKQRTELHLARKIWHFLAVGSMAIGYGILPERLSLTLLAISWLITVPIDFMRLRSAPLNEFITHLVKPLMRKSELTGLMGTTYLLTGVTIVAFLFPKPVVLLSLMFLALADPSASYFGIRFGKDKILGNKSLQGTIAAFAVCSAITFSFFLWEGFPVDRTIILSLCGGVIGALSELIPIRKLDDNLTFPILSSLALWLLFTAFDVFAMLPLF